MGLEDKLYLVRFNIDEERPHIQLKQELCGNCTERTCLVTCPVENYTWGQDGLAFSWQGCLECGACRITCPHEAIEWSYPKGGFGVSFRYG